ncbi:MAG: phage portal protein [Oscillospiraceae bacterium]|nr:phage portal protein [Oscillospiraceae bacterium]MBO6207178.1 phage portal protein [Lachnospiraceae bacterium]
MPGILTRWRTLFRPMVYNISFGPDAPAQVLNLTARQLYNSQDNLAAVVNFLANSIAHLPLKVYVRDGNDNRKRDRDSKAAKVLWLPNSDQTEYEFIRALMVEYYVFGCVYVWVLPDPDSESGQQIRIIPTDWITNTEKTTSYGPGKITVTSTAGTIEIPRTEFVRFSMYAPGNPGGYVSPISALRQTLEEQIQAGRFRRELWKSSGRLNAQIVRPKDVQPWSEETKKRWIEAFREAWGANGSRAGSIPLMEDGMEIKTFNASFKEQQWVESVKLSREAVAAAYRINPSLVWHSDTQTYASSKDNARALYAECLGPDLQMIQQRINSFLLPMIGAAPGTYVEFDLSEKLKGDFEQRASAMQSSVGGPWLTRNEARRDNNLPPVPGGDELIVPLNVISGGQASPTDTHMGASGAESVSVKDMVVKAAQKAKRAQVTVSQTDEEADAVGDALKQFFARQRKSILPKIGAKAVSWWDVRRWDKELADDLEPIIADIVAAHGEIMANALGSTFTAAAVVNYIRKVAESRAKQINSRTLAKLQAAVEAALDSEEETSPQEAAEHEFDVREGFEAGLLGTALAKWAAGWATEEAARQGEEQGVKRTVYKEWKTGPKARASHAAMDGETVLIYEKFSNGADWPGDDSLDPDESCGCNCSTQVIIITE